MPCFVAHTRRLMRADCDGIAPGRLLPAIGVETVVMLPLRYKSVSEDGLLTAYAEAVGRLADPPM